LGHQRGAATKARGWTLGSPLDSPACHEEVEQMKGDAAAILPVHVAGALLMALQAMPPRGAAGWRSTRSRGGSTSARPARPLADGEAAERNRPTRALAA
jgi:hypothetical protein